MTRGPDRNLSNYFYHCHVISVKILFKRTVNVNPPIPTDPNKEKIIQLRKMLAERFPDAVERDPAALWARQLARHQVCPTGLEQVDAQLDGGFPRGALSEVVVKRLTAGSALMLHALISRMRVTGSWMVLVDGSDSFAPDAFGMEGVLASNPNPNPNSDADSGLKKSGAGAGVEPGVLSHLLWVRCRDVGQALKAADMVLRDGNAPLVVMDFRLNAPKQLRKVPLADWYRCQRLVEETQTAAVVFTPHPLISCARVRLALEQSWSLDDLHQPVEALMAHLSVHVLRRAEHRQPEPAARAARAASAAAITPDIRFSEKDLCREVAG